MIEVVCTLIIMQERLTANNTPQIRVEQVRGTVLNSKYSDSWQIDFSKDFQHLKVKTGLNEAVQWLPDNQCSIVKDTSRELP